MSAPLEAYRSKSLFGVNGAGAIQHLRAILQVSDAYMKSTFYLDALFPCVDIDGNMGVVGIIYPGTANYEKHNASKHGSLRIAPNGILLNDSGLNTKGHSSQPIVSNSTVGEITLSSTFKSAFYLTSSVLGFAFKINSESYTQVGLGYSIPANSQLTGGPQIVTGSIIAGDVITVKAFITNTEGEYNSATVSFVAAPKAVLMNFDSTYASTAYYYGSTQTIYSGTKNIAIGTSLYGDWQRTILPAEGYYTASDKWYYIEPALVLGVETMQVVAMGDCTATGWPVDDPAYFSGEYTPIVCYYNSAGYINPCQDYNNELPPNKTIFLRAFDGIYYNETTFDTLVDNGYYVWEGVWRRMSSGVIAETANCPV